MNQGTFRKDLFYRLSVHNIQIPPLRERKDDIKLLADYFIQMASDEQGKSQPTPVKELYQLLKTYSYPGNVRELRAILYNAVSRHSSHVMSLEAVSDSIKYNVEEVFTPENDEQQMKSIFHDLDDLPTIKILEEYLIREAMERSNNNQGIAAGILGITRQTLNKKLKKE